MDFIDEVVDKAQKAGKFVCEKATDAKDYVSLEYKAATLRNKIDVQYKELGKLTYANMGTDTEDHGESRDIADIIRSLMEELNEVTSEMSKFKNVCPSCKTPNPAKAEYCTKCGNKLN